MDGKLWAERSGQGEGVLLDGPNQNTTKDFRKDNDSYEVHSAKKLAQYFEAPKRRGSK